MSQFDVEKFMSEPNEDTFHDLKKDELISLAKYLQLEVKKAMRKHQIQDIIHKHLVSKGLFKETVLEMYESPKPELSSEQRFQLELKKLEMQERLEREEKERQERLEEKERQERLEEKERQERLEEKEQQERLEREEKERQERLEEKERQERLEEKERQERLEKDKMRHEYEMNS